MSWHNVSPASALPYYQQAYTAALQTNDSPSLALLGERFFLLGWSQWAVASYEGSYRIAINFMNSDPARGQNFRYGFDSLNYLITAYNNAFVHSNNIQTQGKSREQIDAELAPRQPLRNIALAASQALNQSALPVQAPGAPQTPYTGGGGTANTCDRSQPDFCDLNRTSRNPR